VQDFHFQHFHDWVQQQVKAGTAKHYFYMVHACLREETTARRLLRDPMAFAAHIIDYDTRLGDSSRNSHRSASRMLARYLETQLGVTLELRFLTRRERRVRVDDPLERLAFELDKYMNLVRVQYVYWRDIRGTGGAMATVEDPRRHRQEYRVPVLLLRELNLWAGGGERAKPEQPFIPHEPKAMYPMATIRLQHLAMRGASHSSS
jgi:hypothetical protein